MNGRRAMFAVSFLLALFRFSSTDLVADSNSPVGLWKNEDATFQIFESDGNLGAKIIALKEPTTPEGNQKTDIHNPDPAKRSTPIIGLVFMSGFVRKSETRWEGGTIYDPKSGNTYHAPWNLRVLSKSKCAGSSAFHCLAAPSIGAVQNRKASEDKRNQLIEDASTSHKRSYGAR
jgi:uncharacterized protein (DUF2147 family)